MKKNFSLIEVLGSVVILAILLSIVFWGYAQINLKLGGAKCISNFNKIYRGVIKHTRENDGYIAPHGKGYRWKGSSFPTHTTSDGFTWYTIENTQSPYWGRFYAPYMTNNPLDARKYFRCPESDGKIYTDNQVYFNSIYDEEAKWTSAGFNVSYLRNSPGDTNWSNMPTAFYWHFSSGVEVHGAFQARKISEVKNKNNLIMMQDSIECIVFEVHERERYQDIAVDWTNPNAKPQGWYEKYYDKLFRHKGKTTIVWANGHITQEENRPNERHLYGEWDPSLVGKPPEGPPDSSKYRYGRIR